MSTTAPSQLRPDPGVRGTGRPVMAAIDPARTDTDAVTMAISEAQPDGSVVLTAVYPPRPLVSHYWFMSDFGSTFWPDDKALPDDDMIAIEQAIQLLDRSGMSYVIDKPRRPEAVLRRSRRKLVAKALAEAAVRHDVSTIIVGPATKPGRSIASWLRDLTEIPVIEADASPSDPSSEGHLVDAAGREAR